MFLVLRATKQLYPSIHHQLLHRQTFILKQRRRRREWWWSSLIQHPFLSRISKQPLFTFAVTASPPLPPHPHVRCVGVFLYKCKFLALPDCTGDHLLHHLLADLPATTTKGDMAFLLLLLLVLLLVLLLAVDHHHPMDDDIRREDLNPFTELHSLAQKEVLAGQYRPHRLLDELG